MKRKLYAALMKGAMALLAGALTLVVNLCAAIAGRYFKKRRA